MIPYIVTIFVLLYFELIYKIRMCRQTKKILCRTTTVAFVVMYSLRSQYIGINDVWWSYVPMFKRMCAQTMSQVLEHGYSDLGFYVFTKYVTYFTHNPQVWLGLCSLPLSIAVCVLIEKKSESPVLSFAMFLGLGYFGYNVFLLRQSMAMGFSIFAYFEYEKKNYKMAFMLFAVACMFHAMTLFLLVYPIAKIVSKRFDWKIIGISAIGICLVFGMLLFNRIASLLNGIDRIQFYLNLQKAGKERLSLTIFFIYLLIFIVILITDICKCKDIEIYCQKEDREMEDNDAMLLMIAVSTGLLAMVNTVGNIYRVSIYFLIYTIVIFPNCICRLTKSRIVNNIVVALCFITFVIYFLGVQINNQLINPYVFWWE